jgi:molecular chaperone DnaK
MDRTRCALIFANGTGDNALLNTVLKERNIPILSPGEIADRSNDVSIIIIDRPAQNATRICSNIRNQDQFPHTPILVLVDTATTADVAQLASFRADILPKPVSAQALHRYLAAAVNGTNGKVRNHDAAVENAKPPSTAAKERDQSPAEAPVVAGTGPEANTIAKSSLAEEKPALSDEIPSSDRLLPERAAHGPMEGSVLCFTCLRWECRREDVFCSGCGEPLAALDDPDDAIIFEPHGEHRVGALIELNNIGQNPLYLAFNIVSSNQIKDRFNLHVENAALDAGSARHLRVTFDARGLNLSTRHQADLQISTNENGFKTRHVELIVERLAIPRVIAKNIYTFVLGAENEWDFNLANDGGGTLSLTRVRLDEYSLDPPHPISIKGGQNLPLRLNIPKLSLSIGRHPKKVIWEFEHYSPIMMNVLVEVARPPRLTVQPSEFDLGVVSTRRSVHLSLTISNSGGEDLIVSSIAAPVGWMQCLNQAPLTIPPGHSKAVDMLAQASDDLAGDQNSEVIIESNSYQNSIHTIPFRIKFVEPAVYQDYIGVDFGTSASCVAVVFDNKPVVIELDAIEPGASSNSRLMPSTLYFNDDGTVLAGREASQAAAIQPANAVTSIKRALGMKHNKVFAGREFNATQLASKVLEQLLARTEDALFRFGQYKSPRRAVITVPVEFHENQRRALLEACRLAGLELDSRSHNGIVIDEAHAAALYYLHQKLLQSEAEDGELEGTKRVLIFDCGGGTLDCALIEIESVGGKVLFKNLSSGGDQHLGGEDIDWALVDLLAGLVKEAHADFDTDCLSDERKLGHKFHNPQLLKAAMETRNAFKNQAEIAKIALSTATAVKVSLTPLLSKNATPMQPHIVAPQPAGDTKSIHMELTIVQQDLQRLLEPFLARAAGVVETVCHRAGVELRSVNTILHTGRTSFLTMIRERINSMLPNAEDNSELVEPKVCVALGAAFWGAIKDKPGTNIEFIGSANRLPQDMGYISVRFVKRVFMPIFSAQAEFPCETVVEFLKSGDWLELRLAENRGKDKNVEGNSEVNIIGLVRIDTRKVDAPVIAVHFAVNENRVLEVTVDGEKQQILESAED